MLKNILIHDHLLSSQLHFSLFISAVFTKGFTYDLILETAGFSQAHIMSKQKY